MIVVDLVIIQYVNYDLWNNIMLRELNFVKSIILFRGLMVNDYIDFF